MSAHTEALKLLPCPFCGNDDPEFERLGTSRQSCIVVCGNCGARHESSDEGARSGSSWNERAALSLPDPLQALADTHAALDLNYENTTPSRSKRMAEAGFTQRDTRLTCDECGKKYTPQMLPIHGCLPDAPLPLAEPKLEDEPHVAAYQYLYAGPYGDVWRNDSGLWNGVAPKACRPLFAERMPLPRVEPSAAPVVPQGWKLVPSYIADLLETGDLEPILYRAGEEHARMAFYNARQAMAAPPAPQQGEQAGQEGEQG